MRYHLLGLLVLAAGTTASRGDVRLPEALSFYETPAGAVLERVDGPARVLLATPTAAKPVIDDRDGASYAYVCHVYVEDNGQAVRRFVVHAPDSSAAPQVRRTARFLAMLWSAANNRFGRLCASLRRVPLRVWLTSEGEPGGELVRDSLYVRRYQVDRSGLEWARTLAHEYGHYLLPSPSVYKEPEPWGNGVLGERLFLGWLHDLLAAGGLTEAALGWGSAEELAEYARKQVAPLRARMRQDGPDAAALRGTDREALDAFTALMLGVDALHGGAMLMDILDYLPPGEMRPRTGLDFLKAYEQWCGQAPVLAWNLEPETPTRVYLTAGTYRIRSASPTGTDIRFPAGLAVHRDASALRLTVRSPGWYSVVLAGGRPALVSVERLAQGGSK